MIANKTGLVMAAALLPTLVFGRDLVWTGSVNEKWNLVDRNWYVKGDTGLTPVAFESGDNAWFVDKGGAGAERAVVRQCPNSDLGEAIWNVGMLVISNEVDSFVFSQVRNDAEGKTQDLKVWSDDHGAVAGMEKHGAGKARFNFRFQHGGAVNVHGGTIEAASGSEYAGEWYSVLGGLYADRRHEATFHPGTTLRFSHMAIFGSICSAPGLSLSLNGATLDFDDARNQNFGDTVFNDVSFVFTKNPARISFSGKTEYRGDRPYVYPCAASDMTFGYNRNFVEVKVEDVTGDDQDDLIISNRLVDAVYGNKFANCTFRKTGKGTMLLANGYSSTTGDFQVAEGVLRLCADQFDDVGGASVVGRLDPPQGRTISISGAGTRLQIDRTIGPRHYPRRWELSLAAGARAEVASEAAPLQLGALALADAQFDYSAIGGFGVAGRIEVAGDTPIVLPAYEHGSLLIGMTPEDEIVPAQQANALASRRSTLEVVVAEVTGDARADATIDLPICDLPDAQFRFQGAIRKSGQGTLRLTAANSYSGGTRIDGGVLEVDGSVAGDLEVREGGYLGGTGAVGRVAIADAGGIAVRLASGVTASAEALKVQSLSLNGATRLFLSSDEPGRFNLANRPLVKIAERPQSLDVGKWSVFTVAGAYRAGGIALSYDPATGIVSANGEMTIPSIEVPRGGMTDYYRIDWQRDTPSATAAGKWSATNEATAKVSAGMLSVVAEENAYLDFTPNEPCNAQPYAAFEADAVFNVSDGELGTTRPTDGAAALVVMRNQQGELAYFAGAGEGWKEACNTSPVTNGAGLVEANVRIETDESDGLAKVSFVVDGVRLVDANGQSWFRRSGSGEIKGSIMVSGVGKLGDVTATRSDTTKLFATREADGSWIYQPTSSIPALVAANEPYYLVMPENCGQGSRYLTRLPVSRYSASGLRVWPASGESCTLFQSNGVWGVSTEKLPASNMDFVVPPLCTMFIGPFSAVSMQLPLRVSGVKGAYGETLGGELKLLCGMSTTPPLVSIGANTRLTLGGALGDGAVNLDVALGGVFDANAVEGGQEVCGIDIDCKEGFGSMSGVKLAKEGALNLSDMSAVRAIGQVPCDLSGAEAAERIMDWRFVVDGVEAKNKRNYGFDDGRITWRNRRYPDDGQAGWENLPMWGGGYMMNVAYTSDPDILYSWADVCGPFRSNDGGKTWNRLSSNLTLGMRSAMMDVFRTISVDPRDPDSIVGLAGGDGRMLVGGFVVSRNGGRSWRKTGWTATYGGEQRMLGTVLERDPHNPDVLVGGEDWYGLWLSRDNGETWTRTCFAKAWFSCVLWDRTTPGRVYACAPSDNAPGGYVTPAPDQPRERGLWRSDDSGATWRKICDEDLVELVQIPGDSRLVGVFNRVHIKISNDDGATWTNFEDGLDIATDGVPGHGEAMSYNAAAAGSDFWLVGDGSGTIYRRGIGDAKWTKLPKPKFSATDPVHEVCEGTSIAKGKCAMSALCSIVIDPRDEDHWFTTDWFSIWETTDAGQNFITRNVNVSQLCSLTIEADPLDERYLAYGVHDMYLMASTNAGSSFFFPNLWFSSHGGSGHLALPSIAYSPFEPGLVFVAGYGVYGDHGVDRSTDHGVTWEHYKCNGLPKRAWYTNGVNEVTFRAGRSSEVWVCAGGIVGPNKAGPYVSTDRGNNWTWCGQGMDEGEQFYTTDTRNGGPSHNLVFSSDGSAVTHCKENDDVYRWSETDKRWFKTALPKGMSFSWKSHSLVADPFTPGRYLISCYRGIAESLDGGVTWHEFAGFSGECTHCAFDVNTPGLLVILADNGVWVSWDGGKTLQELPGGLDFASGPVSNSGSNYSARTVVQLTVDRKRMFVATSTSGVYCRRLAPPPGLKLMVE